eukprot:gene4806-5158_t
MFRRKAPSSNQPVSSGVSNPAVSSVVNRSSSGSSETSSVYDVPQSVSTETSQQKKHIRLSVLYTNQLTKKRKAFSDGVLKIYTYGSNVKCILFAVDEHGRETLLETRVLQQVEIELFRSKTNHILKLQKHMVDVSFENDKEDNVTAASVTSSLSARSGILPKKFVPPSNFVPTTTANTADEDELPRGVRGFKPPSTSSASNMSYGRYPVQEDELDDIWNTTSTSKPKSSNPPANPKLTQSKTAANDDDDNDRHQSKRRKSHERSPNEKKEVRFSTGAELKNTFTYDRPDVDERGDQKSGGRQKSQIEDDDEEEEEFGYDHSNTNNNNDNTLFDGFNLTTNIWTD